MFLKPYTGPPLRYPNTQWTFDMMICRFEDVMPFQSDPAGLTNARAGLLLKSTPAQIKNNFDGVSTYPLAPESLCEKNDAQEMFLIIQSFGLVPSATLFERSFSGAFTMEWNGETRRPWLIGTINGHVLEVAGLMKRYATMPSTVADAKTQDELAQQGLLA